MMEQVVVSWPITCSLAALAWGGDPHVMDDSPYRGAYLAVAESVAKVIAASGDRRKCWLSFQEYFEKLGTAPERWGKPVAALLGALSAQLGQLRREGVLDFSRSRFTLLQKPE